MDIKKLADWEKRTGHRYLEFIMDPMKVQELTMAEVVELAGIIENRIIEDIVEATTIVLNHFVTKAKEIGEKVLKELGPLAETYKAVIEAEKRS